MEFPTRLVSIVGLVVLLLLVVFAITLLDTVAGPNEALIVTGRRG